MPLLPVRKPGVIVTAEMVNAARRDVVTFLIDINVLIALIDPSHAGHDAAHRWFAETGAASWATCPLTDNGVVRIVGHPKYPNSAGSPAAVAPIVAHLRTLPGHVFWNDDLSLGRLRPCRCRPDHDAGSGDGQLSVGFGCQKQGSAGDLRSSAIDQGRPPGGVGLHVINAGG